MVSQVAHRGRQTVAIGSFGLGLGIIVAAIAAPVSHKTVPSVALPDFDLSSLPNARSTVQIVADRDHRLAKPAHDPAELQGDGWTPPARQWGDAQDGPVVELGALGSRRKGLPDVVHLSLDWDF